MANSTENVKIKYDLEDNASPKLGGMNEALSTSIVKGLALYDSLKILGSGIGKMITAAEESRREMAQTQAVLASTGGIAGVSAKNIVEYADSLSKVTNYDDEVIQGGENLLLTFTKIGKDVFPEATKTMLDMSAALDQDVKGSAIQLGKALNDPILGVTALRRVGVSFTEQQLEQIKVMQNSGNILGAQKIILAELKTEFGGAATATADFRTIFKNMAGNVVESIGGLMLPAIDGVLKSFALLGSSLNVIGGGNALNKLFGNIGILLLDIGHVLGNVIEMFSVFVLTASSGFKSLAIRAEGYINIIKSIPNGFAAVKEANKQMQIDILKNDADYNDKYLKIAEGRVDRAKQYDKSYAEIRASINGEIINSDSAKSEKLLKNIQAQSEANTKSTKQQQKEAKDAEKAQKEAFDSIMLAHEKAVTKMQEDSTYTYSKEIAMLEEVLSSKKLTQEQALDIQKDINKLTEKNSKKTFDSIMDSHKESVTEIQLNNQYTHDAEIGFLQNLLLNHRLTQDQQLAITQQINALKLESHKATSAQFLEDTILTFDTYKEMGALSLLYALERNAALLESDKLTTDDRIKLEKKMDDERRRISKSYGESYIAAITDVGNKELSIKDKVLKGSFNFVKQAILKELDAWAATAAARIIGEGLKMAIPTYGASIAIAAGQVALLGAAVATAHSAVDSIKLADGGIVMPRPGGTSAVIGEAGRAEAVIPLGSSKAKKILGDNSGSSGDVMRFLLLDTDGKTTLAKGIYREINRLSRTGQLSGSGV